jgi:hypothetical protein
MRLVPSDLAFSHAARRAAARRAPARSTNPQVRNGAITVIPECTGDLLGVSVDPSSTAATTAQVDQELRGQAAVHAGDPQQGRGTG